MKNYTERRGNMDSKKYTLNKNDLEKIAVGAGIAVGGALLTYIAQMVTQIDFGPYTPIIVAVVSIFINSARKFLQGN